MIKRSRRSKGYYCGLIIIMFAFLINFSLTSAAWAELPGLQLESAIGTQGTTIPVKIWINNQNDAVAGSVYLQYNSDYLAPIMLPSYRAATPWAFSKYNPNTDNKAWFEPGDFGTAANSNLSPGQLRIAVAGTAPVGGSQSVLGSVYFKLLQAGTSNIDIMEATLADTAGNLVPLGNFISGIINVEPGILINCASSNEEYPSSKEDKASIAAFAGTVSSAAALPTNSITINILDKSGNTVMSYPDLGLGGDGSFSGEYTLPLHADIGIYSIQAVYNGTIYYDLDNFEVIADECFIATAAYGSKFEPSVALLRQFRDQFLLSNELGKAFVNFYYRHSPPIAAYIAGIEPLKAVVRIVLTPVVGLVYLLIHPQIAIMALGTGLFVTIIILRTRKKYRETKLA